MGKPITNQNLIRRKFAVFLLIGSIIYNYIATGKIAELYKQNTDYKTQVAKLQTKPPVIVPICPTKAEIDQIVKEDLEKQWVSHHPAKKKSSKKLR
jgi:hypothetical protein